MPETDLRTIDQKLIDADFFSAQDAVYELFTQMRRDDPVHWTVRDDGVGFWSVFKHTECRAVLDDAVLFNTGTTGQMPPFAAELDIVSKKGFGVGESILTTDPPRPGIPDGQSSTTGDTSLPLRPLSNGKYQQLHRRNLCFGVLLCSSY